MGRLATHIATVLILVGGFTSMLFQEKGMIHLQVGQTADEFLSDAPGDAGGDGAKPLGFGVRLDGFELDEYDAEYRLYTYEAEPSGNYRMVASDEPVVGAEVGRPPSGSTTRVKVERVFTHFYADETWLADPMPDLDAPPRPVARLEVLRADGTVEEEEWLKSNPMRSRRYKDPAGRFDVRLDWQAPPAAVMAGLGEAGHPEVHWLVAGDERLEVEPGHTYTLADGRTVEVRAYLPAFNYDIKARRAVSLSSAPVNPALEVVVAAPGAGPPSGKPRYLFARADLKRGMDGHEHGDKPDLAYERTPPRIGSVRTILILAATAERIHVVEGQEVARFPMVWGEPFAVAGIEGEARLRVGEPLRHAKAETELTDDPDDPENRAVEVSVSGPSIQTYRTVLLAESPKPQPIDLGGGRILVYQDKPERIRNFESTVTILEGLEGSDGGQPVLTRVLRVNEPLSHRGFDLYQANYDPKNPRYSGIQVVRDPGVGLVMTGFWLLMLAVLHVVALRRWKPWWERRGSGGGDAAEEVTT